ncbi:hypothetical protein LO762_30020 [Actinocorallia sp. API 0066]|uniref:hypothetical protein n=1 Tax=Actinocorallia sp. API 0066 TaxID=2896846 RepID=UPI001E595B60|nr:hypothetical protein [Actinocorallia sp. API 0066]MCD0453386.1 hypothetical protein [Actinocorallia sp. API 0066]
MDHARLAAAVAVVLPLGLAAPASAAAPSAQRRAVTLEAVAVTPADPVLYDARTTKLTARIRATGASSVTVDFGPHEGLKQQVQAARTTLSGTVQQWEAELVLDRGRPTGLWDVKINAWDGAATTATRTEQVFVRRETRFIRFDAAPEPVRAGGRLRLEGTLARLDPLRALGGGLVRYGGANVRLYFSGDHQEPRVWRYVANAVTDADGRFAKTVPARSSGYWRAGHTGSTHYAASRSWPDYVRVTR